MTANRAYPFLFDLLLSELTTATMLIQLVDDTYVYDPADMVLDNIPASARVGPLTAVAGTLSASGGELVTDTSTQTIPSVTGDTVTGWLYVMDGADDTSRVLVGGVTRRADTTPISVVPDGGDVTITIPGGVILAVGV